MSSRKKEKLDPIGKRVQKNQYILQRKKGSLEKYGGGVGGVWKVRAALKVSAFTVKTKPSAESLSSTQKTPSPGRKSQQDFLSSLPRVDPEEGEEWGSLC